MIKILIADDQELVRNSLKILLNSKPDFEVIGTVKSGTEVITSLETLKPDVILMDIRMPEMDGVACTKVVKEKYPHIKVILLTTFDDDEYIFNALKYGASGYLLKESPTDELADSIKTVLGGGSIIHPSVATKAFHLFSEMANQPKINLSLNEEGVYLLSNSEWRVIQKVALGLSNKEIAKETNFSEGTIRNYLYVIMEKLQITTRTQLAIWYLQTGFDFDPNREA